MNLYGNPARAIAGQKYGLQDVTESRLAAGDIEPENFNSVQDMLALVKRYQA